MVFRRYVSEYNTGRYFGAGPEARGLEEIGLAKFWKAEEPEDGFWDAGKNAKPGAED